MARASTLVLCPDLPIPALGFFPSALYWHPPLAASGTFGTRTGQASAYARRPEAGQLAALGKHPNAGNLHTRTRVGRRYSFQQGVQAGTGASSFGIPTKPVP